MATGGSHSGSASVGGFSFNIADTIATGTGVEANNATLAAAKTGTLTTRTSGVAGTLTMTSGHGITTGARISIFWPTTTTGVINTAGVTYVATVGTVSVNSVPFTLGAGDALPLVNTAVTVMVPTAVTCTITGANVIALAGGCAGAAFAVAFTQSDNTAIAAVYRSAAGAEYWQSGQTMSATNPVTGVTIGKIFVSHGDSTSSRVVTGAIAYT